MPGNANSDGDSPIQTLRAVDSSQAKIAFEHVMSRLKVARHLITDQHEAGRHEDARSRRTLAQETLAACARS